MLLLFIRHFGWSVEMQTACVCLVTCVVVFVLTNWYRHKLKWVSIILLNPCLKRVFPIVRVYKIRCSLFKSFGDATRSFEREGAFTCVIIGLLLHYLLIRRIKKYICIYLEVLNSELAMLFVEASW